MDQVDIHFGGAMALQNIPFKDNDDEIMGIKVPAVLVSLLNCITVYYCPNKEKIYFRGEDITNYPTHKIACLGLNRTFQNIELY